jgi:hypothetical protein
MSDSPFFWLMKPNAPAKLQALNEKEASRQLQPVVSCRFI